MPKLLKKKKKKRNGNDDKSVKWKHCHTRWTDNCRIYPQLANNSPDYKDQQARAICIVSFHIFLISSIP